MCSAGGATDWLYRLVAQRAVAVCSPASARMAEAMGTTSCAILKLSMKPAGKENYANSARIPIYVTSVIMSATAASWRSIKRIQSFITRHCTARSTSVI